MRLHTPLAALSLLLALPPILLAADGNRLAYLDGDDPYYVHRDFPRLTTPQWVGEEGVEAVVVLAIDDMRDNVPKYEAFLRPILDRLKAIDGRAPLSIMTNRVDPKDPHLQQWLKEGVSIEVHTLAHPCPLLQKGDFPAAARTYHGCVDLMGQISGNRPVAFRMPCCDSRNTVSPRFYAEIFNKTSPEGHFLTIDSSIFNILTPNDPSLPRELVYDADGRERFRKYLPFPSFVNTIEDYPYPYVIGRLCWEFPCVVPSDWEAQNLHKPNHPKTVEDLKAALDAIVIKQGVFNLVFHPHNWIKSEQVVELIDHAVKQHGRKVKFLNFREAQERLDQHLLGGHSLRATDGRDNGVRLLDIDHDGYMDVVIGNEHRRQTRLWSPKSGRWRTLEFPVALVDIDAEGNRRDTGVRFGTSNGGRDTLLFVHNETTAGLWTFGGSRWLEASREQRERLGLLTATEPTGSPVFTSQTGRDRGARFRDLNGDGECELIVGNEAASAVFARNRINGPTYERLGFALPEGARIVGAEGRDAGLRFVDLDEDGYEDVVFSNDEGYGIYLFDMMGQGWTRKVVAGRPGEAGALPKIARGGTNNGFWVHSRHLWWQNEDTAPLPDLVDRRSFNDLLKDVEPRAKSAEASLRSIRVKPGFQVELVASEPLVQDPIAFDWGADGKLWVVEMGDYPLGLDGKGKPGGVVRYLEDTDNDGKYDRSTVFLDGLGFPTGIMPWRDGVLISCAPDILFAADRDGDGKADVREVLFTGFREGNQQHRVNGFDLGLDGWVYAANGDSGGLIRSTKTGEQVPIAGRDIRLRPDEGRIEPESGQTQYGRHRDDWGHWFGGNNSVLAWHFVLAERDLRRNPRFAPSDTKQRLDPDTRLYPVSRTLPRFNSPGAENHVTSANSPLPYRDELFGPAFAGSLFVSEPVHNLIRRVIVEPDGASFRGRRAADEADREFLASSDNWFRPTMLRTGPDGALWIADMYRAVIEHPEWIPDDWEARLDLRAGHDQGRIYRVYPVGASPRPIPRLDRLDTAGLVAALDSPNGWQRDTAQRLLLHRADRSAVPLLRRLLGARQRPKTRVQALWTLEELGGLEVKDILALLDAAEPEVRRNALQAGREVFKAAPGSSLDRLVALVDDPDSKVRFQLALTLGDLNDPRAARALAALLRRDGADPWARAAVLCSAKDHAPGILAELFARAREEPPSGAIIEPLFAMIDPDQGGPERRAMLDAILIPAGQGNRHAPWQFAALAGLLDAAERAKKPLDRWGGDDPGWKQALARLPEVIASARRLAGEDEAPEEARLSAIRVLGRLGSQAAEDRSALAALLRPQVPPRLQQAAVAALGRGRDEKTPEVLLADWKGYTPALRAAILDTLLSRDAWASALLFALEDTCVPPAEIGPAHRRRLLEHRDPKIRVRAQEVFSDAGSPRAEIVMRYREALDLPGDPRAGEAVFRRACASCHRLRGEGAEVGPDLTTLADKSPETLLIAILDPNRAFEARYQDYAIQTTDGRVLSGLIAAETATSVTLRRQEGKEETLLRSEIEAMAATGRSLMPEGLEKDLSTRDLADLIALLTTLGPPRKVVAGNQPELVQPGPDGTITLKATQAEIFGSILTLEPHYHNLGLWSAPDDRAAWTFQITRPGRFAVWIDAACADGSAGNRYILQVGPARLAGQVVGTGTWDHYRWTRLGTLSLSPGRHRLEFRPDGKIRGALIDLRTVELRPEAAEETPRGCCDPGE